MKWTALVGLYDTDTRDHIGDSWEVTGEADNLNDARVELRRIAWEDVDSRINDSMIVFIDGPFLTPTDVSITIEL